MLNETVAAPPARGDVCTVKWMKVASSKALGLFGVALACACSESTGASTSGSSEGTGAGPTLRTIEVIVRDDASDVALREVHVLSHDAEGALVDRALTDEEGRASVQVPERGFVSSAAVRTIYSAVGEETSLVDVAMLESAEVTSTLDALTFRMRGHTRPTRVLANLRVNVAPLPGVDFAWGIPACSWRNPESEASLSGTVFGWTDVPGCDDGQFEVLVIGVDVDDRIIAYGRVDGIEVEDGATVEVGAHLAYTDMTMVDVLAFTPPAGASSGFSGAARSGGLVGPRDLGEESSAFELAMYPSLGGTLEWSANSIGDCIVADLHGSQVEPTEVSWDPRRLAVPTFEVDAIVTEGTVGDAVVLEDRRFDPEGLSSSWTLRLAAKSSLPLPPNLDVPADLEGFVAAVDEPAVVAMDLRDAESYEEFVARVGERGHGVVETVSGGVCLD